jgi:Phosphotransferase enzyme family
LVHGDTKPGNFAFVDGEVSGVFDWEMATIGDPLTDIGWAEVNWRFPGFVTAADGAPTADELVERWEALTGIRARHRPWYRALQGLKIAVILLVGGHLYGSGQSTDARLLDMAYGVDPLTQAALADLEIDARCFRRRRRATSDPPRAGAAVRARGGRRRRTGPRGPGAPGCRRCGDGWPRRGIR